jgi:hypothetical protein
MLSFAQFLLLSHFVELTFCLTQTVVFSLGEITNVCSVSMKIAEHLHSSLVVRKAWSLKKLRELADSKCNVVSGEYAQVVERAYERSIVDGE